MQKIYYKKHLLYYYDPKTLQFVTGDNVRETDIFYDILNDDIFHDPDDYQIIRTIKILERRRNAKINL